MFSDKSASTRAAATDSSKDAGPSCLPGKPPSAYLISQIRLGLLKPSREGTKFTPEGPLQRDERTGLYYEIKPDSAKPDDQAILPAAAKADGPHSTSTENDILISDNDTLMWRLYPLTSTSPQVSQTVGSAGNEVNGSNTEQKVSSDTSSTEVADPSKNVILKRPGVRPVRDAQAFRTRHEFFPEGPLRYDERRQMYYYERKRDPAKTDAVQPTPDADSDTSSGRCSMQ